MGCQFFADHCVSNAIMPILREAVYEVARLQEHLPVEFPDADVIAKAQQLDALLLSLHGDFVDIDTHLPANYQGIIALQWRGQSTAVPPLMHRRRNSLGPEGHQTRIRHPDINKDKYMIINSLTGRLIALVSSDQRG